MIFSKMSLIGAFWDILAMLSMIVNAIYVKSLLVWSAYTRRNRYQTLFALFVATVGGGYSCLIHHYDESFLFRYGSWQIIRNSSKRQMACHTRMTADQLFYELCVSGINRHRQTMCYWKLWKHAALQILTQHAPSTIKHSNTDLHAVFVELCSHTHR